MESKIFSRLTAWQRLLIFSAHAVAKTAPLRRYGTGQKAQFDMTRFRENFCRHPEVRATRASKDD